eukprot:5572503-Prymnesium_polylepis.1
MFGQISVVGSAVNFGCLLSADRLSPLDVSRTTSALSRGISIASPSAVEGGDGGGDGGVGNGPDAPAPWGGRT